MCIIRYMNILGNIHIVFMLITCFIKLLLCINMTIYYLFFLPKKYFLFKYVSCNLYYFLFTKYFLPYFYHKNIAWSLAVKVDNHIFNSHHDLKQSYLTQDTISVITLWHCHTSLLKSLKWSFHWLIPFSKYQIFL